LIHKILIQVAEKHGIIGQENQMQDDVVESEPFRLRACLDADWLRFLQFGGIEPQARRFRDNFSPRFAPVMLIRVAHRLYVGGFRRSAKLTALVNFIIFGLEVPARLAIGQGLVIPHTHGTIIGAGYVGRNVTIFQQVTLGAKLADFGYNYALRPHVCSGVTITAGAKIIGPVRLGEGCTIGANAVVLSDIPDGALAVGVPARFKILPAV
jgi:serine O-acetyltransferase